MCEGFCLKGAVCIVYETKYTALCGLCFWWLYRMSCHALYLSLLPRIGWLELLFRVRGKGGLGMIMCVASVLVLLGLEYCTSLHFCAWFRAPFSVR